VGGCGDEAVFFSDYRWHFWAATWALLSPRMKREVLRLYRARDPDSFKGWEGDFLALSARKPTLVIRGDRDRFISKRFAERFNARRVVHLPDVGHWPPVEAPAECAEAILQFLGSSDGAA